MYYIYGAERSRATDKAETLLASCLQKYKIFFIGRDYTVEQLRRLHPNTNQIPHVYYGFEYVGGLKELYDHLYTVTKFYDGENEN